MYAELMRTIRDRADGLEARLERIEQRLDVLLRALAVIVDTNTLEDDSSMKAIVDFREQHRRLLFYDRQFSTLAETIGKWVIRAMVAFVFASAAWAISNIEILRRLWEHKL